MVDDLRYALRMLLKRPAFTFIALSTLAFGIGANTVVFSGVYSFFLERLSYPHADRLVVISQADLNGVETGLSYPDFVEWKEQNTVFERMAVSRTVSMNLTGSDPVERVTGSLISEEFMPMLGGSPLIGRGFLSEDFRPGGEKTLILNHTFWQRRFGGDANVIGKRLTLNDRVFIVIGVMPREFQYPFRASFWTPLDTSENSSLLLDRSANIFEAVALLKEGMTVSAASTEMARLAQRSSRENRTVRQDSMVRVTGLRETLPGAARYRTPILVLQLAVVFVLLIACTNLANMLLARYSDRRQEFTIRLAMGAGRGRLMRQLLTESMLFGLGGCLLGVLLALWGIEALRSVIPWRAPGMPDVGINTTVLLVTLFVSLLTSLGFGLVPSIIASRQDLNEFLKAGSGNTTSDRGRQRLSRALVCSEVALAVVLLVASGLMIRTFLNLTEEDPGFDPSHAVALSLSLPASRYSDQKSLADYYGSLFSEIKSLPGVEFIGAVSYMPLVGYNPGTSFTVDEGPSTSNEAVRRADFQPVTHGYFEAMRVPLLGGRDFTGSDSGPSPSVVMINNALAKRLWPGEDPLGKSMRVELDSARPLSVTVVGVVGDVKQFGLHAEPRPEIYMPGYRHSMTAIIRTSPGAGNMFSVIREVMERYDGSGTAFGLKTLEQAVADSIEKRRIFMLLLGSLAAVAVLMAAMGIYGVISYMISQRTREIGIRMALGAGRDLIMLSVIKQGVRLALAGCAIGLAASLLLTRAMKGLLFGVSANDPIILAAMTSGVLMLAIIASYVPARRASKVDPIKALKCE